jgi:hypothetical protein
MLAGDAERVVDERAGRPVRHADASTRPAHPDQLVGHPLLICGEDGAERGQHDVEAVVAERQLLGVGHLGAKRHAVGVSDAPGRLQEVVDEVGGDDVGPPARSGDRGGAVTGTDVEDRLARVDVERLTQQFAVEDAVRADACVVARRPRPLLAGRDGLVVTCGRGGSGHGRLLGSTPWGRPSRPALEDRFRLAAAVDRLCRRRP